MRGFVRGPREARTRTARSLRPREAQAEAEAAVARRWRRPRTPAPPSSPRRLPAGGRGARSGSGRSPNRSMAAGGGAVERRLRATLGGGGGGDGGAVSHRARPCQSRAAQPPPQSATRRGRGWAAQAQKHFWPGRLIPLTVDVVCPGRSGIMEPSLRFRPAFGPT